MSQFQSSLNNPFQVSNVMPDYTAPVGKSSGVIYQAEEDFYATFSYGSGARAIVEVSKNADMSQPRNISEIYITSTGYISFTHLTVIPKGYYYRCNKGSLTVFPLKGQS